VEEINISCDLGSMDGETEEITQNKRKVRGNTTTVTRRHLSTTATSLLWPHFFVPGRIFALSLTRKATFPKFPVNFVPAGVAFVEKFHRNAHTQTNNNK